jgi:hypothetical protein
VILCTECRSDSVIGTLRLEKVESRLGDKDSVGFFCSATTTADAEAAPGQEVSAAA